MSEDEEELAINREETGEELPIYLLLAQFLERTEMWSWSDMNNVFQALRTQVRAIQQTSLLGSHCRLFVELRRTPSSMYDRMTDGLRNMNGLIDEWAQEEAAVLSEEGQRVWCGLLAKMVMMVAVIRSLMHSQRTPRDHMVDFRNCAGVVFLALAKSETKFEISGLFDIVFKQAMSGDKEELVINQEETGEKPLIYLLLAQF